MRDALLLIILIAFNFNCYASIFFEIHDPILERSLDRNNVNDYSIFELRSLDEALIFNYTHSIDLTLVRISDRNLWTNEELLFRLQQTQKIFNKCNLKIQNIKLIDAYDVLGKIGDYKNKSSTENLEQILDKIPNINGGAMVFFLSKDVVEGKRAFSFSAGGRSLFSPFVNTMWLSTTLFDKPTRSGSEYETLAHELGHLLLSKETLPIGHPYRAKIDKNSHFLKDEKNLMALKSRNLYTTLSDEQCGVVQQSSLVQEIELSN